MPGRPARGRTPSDSSDDDAYDPAPPPDAPSAFVLLGVWLLFAPPLLLAVPALFSDEGGFEALLRVLAGGYVVVAGLVLWHATRRYVSAAPTPKRARADDGPDAEDEADVFDEDAEEV